MLQVRPQSLPSQRDQNEQVFTEESVEDTTTQSQNEGEESKERSRSGLFQDSTWLAGLELEASMTAWLYDVKPMRSESDDWSNVTKSAKYRIDPTAFYRLQLTALTRWIDVSVQYELHSGLSLGTGGGSLLDLALGLPELVPFLSPLSLHYQRLRFERGEANLEVHGLLIERQRFRSEIDQFELRWLTLGGASSALSLTGRYHQRALPRQIYLQERVVIVDDFGDEEGESFDAYYDISDQLLYVPTESYELGVLAELNLFSSLHFALGAGIGFGSYELQTPLEGQKLDSGTLFSLGVDCALRAHIPLLDWLELTLAYEVKIASLVPLGLPSKLNRELKSEFAQEGEEVDLSDFSLSFGSLDVLQRFWMGLVFHL